MEETKKKLKVYCETSFWSWLVSRPSTNPDHAVKQAWTRKWWEEAAQDCEIFISEHVLTEAARGDDEQARCRMDVLLTWNCRHLANRFALPKTIAVVTKAGFQCPAIVTPENFLKEDLDA